VTGLCDHGNVPSDSIKARRLFASWETQLLKDMPCTVKLATLL
jgi:hypothetical protein